MRFILSFGVVMLVSFSALAEPVSVDRQAAMVPYVARDREQAMNDRALCSADLATASRQLNDALTKLDAANRQIEELKEKKPE